MSDEEAKEVNAEFDKLEIAYVIIWLDLVYTDDRMYFTFDPTSPIAIQSQFHITHRKVVVLIAPICFCCVYGLLYLASSTAFNSIVTSAVLYLVRHPSPTSDSPSKSLGLQLG